MKFKLIAFTTALCAANILFQADVSAQQARTYKYCLEQGMPNSFPLNTCYYETMEQCLASKTSPSDRCSINPQWQGKR